MPATPEKASRSSQKSRNRRKKGSKNMARELAARANRTTMVNKGEMDGGPNEGFTRSIPDSPDSLILCPMCDNLGMFSIAGEYGPGLLRYCECAHGSQMLALMVELASGLRVKEADRFIVARHVTFAGG